ncbi:hypothetical protein MK489_02240 [Myxococcota bacterium]|nr:hypothetical protein [Myxococcota bacterium]
MDPRTHPRCVRGARGGSLARWFVWVLSLIALAPAARSEPTAWLGTLSIEFVRLPPIEIQGHGVATLQTTGARLDGVMLSGGLSGSGTVAMPSVGGLGTISVGAELELGSGSLDPQLSGMSADNRLPVAGVLKLCMFFPGCGLHFPLDLTGDAGARGVGVGGQLTAGGAGALRISVDTAPWTLGTALLWPRAPASGETVLSAHGWAHGPNSLTQSTALPGGQLSLVTPVQVASQIGHPWLSFARLHLHFVPEPRRAALLGVGCCALLLLGGLRRRNSVRAGKG